MKQAAILSLLTVLLAVTLIPFYATLTLSHKTNAEILTEFWAWPTQAHWKDYYGDAIRTLGPYMRNSIIVSCVSVLGVLALASLSGYVFARMRFTGKGALYMMLLSLMMIPGILTLIPAFNWVKGFPLAGGNDWLGRGGSGLLDTWWVLWLPYWAGGQIFGILLCRTFFETLPEELFEAARIDGASDLFLYRSIAVPLSLPILATLAIMNFFGTYNDYVWPLVTLSTPARQVFSIGVTKFGFEGNLDLGAVMAGYVVGSIPLLILFGVGMKYYVQGLTSGALKA
ncbi:MAG: carbohydrate ABC transporter permease [bacterium]|nr:carbohydrate ABC transporter permease [bacterium]